MNSRLISGTIASAAVPTRPAPPEQQRRDGGEDETEREAQSSRALHRANGIASTARTKESAMLLTCTRLPMQKAESVTSTP